MRHQLLFPHLPRRDEEHHRQFAAVLAERPTSDFEQPTSSEATSSWAPTSRSSLLRDPTLSTASTRESVRTSSTTWSNAPGPSTSSSSRPACHATSFSSEEYFCYARTHRVIPLGWHDSPGWYSITPPARKPEPPAPLPPTPLDSSSSSGSETSSVESRPESSGSASAAEDDVDPASSHSPSPVPSQMQLLPLQRRTRRQPRPHQIPNFLPVFLPFRRVGMANSYTISHIAARRQPQRHKTMFNIRLSTCHCRWLLATA